MTNWLVALVNTIHPFDIKYEVVNSETISEALDLAEQVHKPYFARSARFHSSFINGEVNHG